MLRNIAAFVKWLNQNIFETNGLRGNEYKIVLKYWFTVCKTYTAELSRGIPLFHYFSCFFFSFFLKVVHDSCVNLMNATCFPVRVKCPVLGFVWLVDRWSSGSFHWTTGGPRVRLIGRQVVSYHWLTTTRVPLVTMTILTTSSCY